jgi:hypothetical protein
MPSLPDNVAKWCLASREAGCVSFWQILAHARGRLYNYNDHWEIVNSRATKTSALPSRQKGENPDDTDTQVEALFNKKGADNCHMGCCASESEIDSDGHTA